MPITVRGDRFSFIDSDGDVEASLYMSNGVVSIDGVPIEAISGDIVATGTLSQADIFAMYATPITLIPSPGAGLALVILSIQWRHDYAVAPYTGGGKIRFFIGNGGNVLAQPKEIITEGANGIQSYMVPSCYDVDATTGTFEGFPLEEAEDSPLSITNDTAAFANGNVGNFVKWRVVYKVVPLIT